MSSIRIPYVKPRLHADGGYRPRWEPGPRQRALGFTATDLKHDDGRWFSIDEAAAYATRMLAEVQARTAAPSSAPKLPRKAGKSVGDLLDAYFRSEDFRRLREQTRRDYEAKAEAVRWQPRTHEERKAGVAKVPEPIALAAARAVTKANVRAFFEYLCNRRGRNMARGAVMLLSGAYKWASYTQGWELEFNPCRELNLPSADPRVMTWSVAELHAFITAADAAGLPSIADATMLALFSGQRQGDVLSLVDEVGNSVAKRTAAGEPIRFLQSKTQARVAIFAAPDLVARLARAEERRAAVLARHKVVPLHGKLPVVMNERYGREWEQATFRKRFLVLRREAAAANNMPRLLELHFSDLRDTAVTWLAQAGCTIPEICSYTGHALASATAILRHYLELGEPIAREAARKQLAWLEREGVRL